MATACSTVSWEWQLGDKLREGGLILVTEAEYVRAS